MAEITGALVAVAIILLTYAIYDTINDYKNKP